MDIVSAYLIPLTIAGRPLFSTNHVSKIQYLRKIKKFVRCRTQDERDVQLPSPEERENYNTGGENSSTLM